ncbi:hypothetical protein K1W54_04125 [Micromonospora sp. CPCC 205371]|nr:hypothetical protein [Micromonospora sp. CPCC 205371]
MQLEVLPASFELETRPDVVGYTSLLLAREEHRLLSLMDAGDPGDVARRRYEAQVGLYLSLLESAVYDRTDKLLGLRKIAPLQVSVRNLGELLVQGARVTIRLHAHGQRQLLRADLDEALLTEIPIPPTPPGKEQIETAEEQSAALRARARQAQRQIELSEQIRLSPHPLHHGLRNVVEPDTAITSTEDERLIELVYPEFDLRPGQVLQLPDVALDLLEPVDATCEATWTVTARNHGGVLTGRFELFTVADPYALARTWPAESIAPQSVAPGQARTADACAVGATRPACAILDHVNPLLLAAAGELPSTKLRRRLRDAAEEIVALAHDTFDDGPRAVIERLFAKYRVPVTAYSGEPMVVGPPREYRKEIRDVPHPTRMVTRTMRDYTVAVNFDGDSGIVRASLATCHHEPRWQVQGSQIRAVFTVDPTVPAPELERWIRERTADATTHLANTQADLDHYHEELNRLLEDMVPKMVAVRLAGQRQREELNLPFLDPPDDEQSPTSRTEPGRTAARSSADVDLDLLFREVVDAAQSAATTLATHAPLVEALGTEDLLRFQLSHFLTSRLPEPYLFTAETFRGQGKVDIAIHWNGRLVGIIECKVWHSERKFREGIDQVLSYLPPEDTRVAYVVFIKQQTVTPIIEVLRRTMFDHDNCADTELPTGTGPINFAFHATADPARPITMVLLPMPLATSATGASTGRGLRGRRQPPIPTGVESIQQA